MSDSTVKYPASLVPVGAFAGKPAMPLTRQMIVVGSSKHSRILLKSDTVSSVHTFLVINNGRWYFRDLVSRTHTILNGKSIREGELKNGDTITIGAFVFHFVAPEPKDPVIKVPPAALDITDAEIPVPIDTKTVLIGKRPGCEVRLMEEGVSTAHAILFECNGVHYIRDLYSRGGTFLNGTKVHQEVLKFGDVIVIGETTIKYIPDSSVESEAPNLLDESSRPVILHDDPMASHDAPLVARDLPPIARNVPFPGADRASQPGEFVRPAAEAPVESTDTRSDLRKPAEIRATLPAGLSSLLDTAGLTSADALKPPAEFEARRDLFEPLPIEEADELVVPLRRRETAETSKPVVDEVEPSSIAPDVDEIRPTAASVEIEPADEIDVSGPISADIDEAIPVEEDEALSIADAEEDAIPVAEVNDEPEALADIGPAVANRPLEVNNTPEVVAAEPVDVEIEPIAIEADAAETRADQAVASIDVVDEAELSEAPEVVAETHAPGDEVASTIVSLPPVPESAVEEPIDVETQAVATVNDDVATGDELVSEEAVTTDEVVGTEDVTASASVPVEFPPVAAPSPISRELAELAAEIEATLARATTQPPAIDRPVVRTPEVEASEPALPPLDVKTFAEQIRRDFAAEDARSALEKEDVQLESKADVEATPQSQIKPQVELEPIAEAPAAPAASPAVSPLESIEQSPELRQLADLQARIAAALEDPSSMSREPILPPGAPLVSDPDTAMNAAARRARLIAEMLEETEPIEEEAEREAQSISFDIDESAIPPKVEPITEVETPPIEVEVPIRADESEASQAAEVSQAETEADSRESDEHVSDADDIVSVEETIEAAAVEVAPAEEDSISLERDEVSLAENEIESIEQPSPLSEQLSEELAGETASIESAEEEQSAYDLNIDAADTLPADIARGDDVAVPTADLIAPEKVDAYPASDSVPNAKDVVASSFAMPSGVELSELPVFDSSAEVELKSEAAAPLPSIELELPAPEALDAPLEVDEVEPTLHGSARDELTVRDQDVFDKASIDASALPVLDVVAAEETPVDGALLATDEVRDAGEIIHEPASAAPTLDPSEPVSESANDELLGEEFAGHTAVGAEGRSGIAGELAEPVVEEIASVEEPLEVEVEVVDSETAEAIEDEIFAQQDEKPELIVETPETAEELAAQPDEIAVEVNDPIAPVESDEYNAGEVIITGVDVGPEAAAREETPVEAQPTFELPAVADETPVVAEPALTNGIKTDRIILESEEEEPLERQSRPLIAADEHLVGDEIDELAVAEAEAEAAADAEVPPKAHEPEAILAGEVPEVDAAFEVQDVVSDALPTIEVDISSAQNGQPFDQSTNPFAQETPAPAATGPLEPIVAEGTTEAAKRPLMVQDPSMFGIDKPRAMNISVPSLDDLQAEFDDAFADALAMAEGKSFAGEPKVERAAEIAKPFETAAEQERSLEGAKPQAAIEATSEETTPLATLKPMGAQQGNVVNVNVPSLEKLEADFRDSFAEALAMAEGQSFAKAKFAPRDKLDVGPTPQPTAETPATTPVETSARARPVRKLPEFKLDESLLDQAEKMGPVGGSPAPMGAAAFMNLGGIGWIGDETLDDFEIVNRKPAKPKRRSRQRRPVGDQLSKPETTAQESVAEESVEPISKSSEAFDETNTVKPAPVSETPADVEVADVDHVLNTANAEHVARAREFLDLEPVSDTSAADELVREADEPFRTEPTATTADLDDLIAGQIEEDEIAANRAEEDDAPHVEVEEIKEVEDETTPRAVAAPSSLPTIIPPRPTRPRKSQAVVDQALSMSSGSPFAAQELPLVDAFSGAATPQLDEVLARLNTSGGAVKDHPPITQDRPISNGSEVKVPVSPFASQIPIAQPAGSVHRVRQRVSKLPLITGGMLILMLVSSLIWLIPVPSTVRGEVKFKNLDRTTELVRKELQRNFLGKLPDLQQAARQHVEDFEGGFLDLDRREAWEEIVRKAHFDSQMPNTLVLEVPSNVNQAKLDEKRLKAVITEFVKANKDLSDELNKMRDETGEIERARANIDGQLASVKEQYDKLGVTYETGTITNTALKKVEKELATLDESRKQAAAELETREAELKKLEAQMLSSGILFRGSWMRAVPGIVLADASGAVASVEPLDATVELARLQRERDDLAARIDRLTAARSPETAAARESFDRALDAFSKQVEEARKTLGDRPEVLEYVQSASKLQDQIREMTDTLVRRQEQQITRLNEFQLKLKEHTQSNRDHRINNDPELKVWMDDLAFQERRLNVARESNASAEDVRDIERNISFLKSNIAAKQELLADPSEVLMVRDIESMIEATKRDMATDRQRNDSVLAEVQNVFKSNQPVLEALPVEQRQVTQGLTERLAQIDLARQRYTDSLAVVAGSDETLLADARQQLAVLDQKIATTQNRVQQDAIAHSQEMEKRTEIAKRVEDARARMLATRATWEELDRQYRSKLEARDALAAKVTDWKAAATDRELLEKQKADMEKRRNDLIVRRKAIEERMAFAVVPDPSSTKIQVLGGTQSDPRLKYFGIAMLGILSVGAGLMTMEVRNRIPVPQQAGDETSDSQTPPLSGTPTVA